MHGILLLVIILAAVTVPLLSRPSIQQEISDRTEQITQQVNTIFSSPVPSPTATPYPTVTAKTLPTDYHVFQTFNNCGPAALSMTLNFYGIRVSQKVLGDELRPFQNPQGNNDDKSTSLPELGAKAEEYNFVSFHRPNGNIELVKRAVSAGFPVITRTWLKPDDDVGHFRVIKGFNEATKTFLQDDSLQGKNLTYTYSEFDKIWEKFNYEFLLLIPEDKAHLAESILQENYNEDVAWSAALSRSEAMLKTDPSNIYERFNYSVALFHKKQYQKSVEEFEKIESKLPFRTLWYQTEPIEAYYELGNYDRVLQMTQKILDNQNRAYSELYIIRGNIYKKQGKTQLAREEYEKAVLYNKNMDAAKDALASLY